MTSDLINSGIAACKKNDFAKGVELFTQALAEGDYTTEALYNRARAYAKLEDQAASLTDFARLKSLHPTNASYIGDYAVSLHLNDRNEEALVEFELALSLEPQNPYRHASLAFFKDRMGDHEGAVKAYEQAIALDPEDAISLNNKGLIEEKMGRKKASIESYNKSNQIVGYDPEQTDLSQYDSQETKAAGQAPKAPETRTEVFRSIFTKEGFKDFWRFSKGLFMKKKD